MIAIYQILNGGINVGPDQFFEPAVNFDCHKTTTNVVNKSRIKFCHFQINKFVDTDRTSRNLPTKPYLTFPYLQGLR